MNYIKITYRFFVVVNFATFFLLSAIGLDFLLPNRVVKEVVLEWRRGVEYVTSSRYHSGVERPSGDTAYLLTENFQVQIHRFQKFPIEVNDTLKVYQGRLTGLVLKAGLLKGGFERRIDRAPTMFGNLIFIPIITFLTSMVGVFCYKKTRLTIELGSTSLLLVLMVFLLMS